MRYLVFSLVAFFGVWMVSHDSGATGGPGLADGEGFDDLAQSMAAQASIETVASDVPGQGVAVAPGVTTATPVAQSDVWYLAQSASTNVPGGLFRGAVQSGQEPRLLVYDGYGDGTDASISTLFDGMDDAFDAEQEDPI